MNESELAHLATYVRAYKYATGLSWPEAAREYLETYRPDLDVEVCVQQLMQFFGQDGTVKADWMPRPFPPHTPAPKETPKKLEREKETDEWAFLRHPRRVLEALGMMRQRGGDPDD